MINNFEKINKSLIKRNRSEKTFKFFGLLGIIFAISFLVLILSSIQEDICVSKITLVEGRNHTSSFSSDASFQRNGGSFRNKRVQNCVEIFSILS